MNVKDFSSLSRRDFQNGAVIDEIYTALKQREELIKLLARFINDPVRNTTTWLEASEYLREIQK